MRRILAGVETEYGLLVEGHGAEDQVEDATTLVRGYPGECLALWDYRHESPRADLRGFQLKRLAVDPVDEAFDVGKSHGRPEDVRSDRVLTNGARFYNDHGHPEYATPECWSADEVARQDRLGESIVLDAARQMAATSGRSVQLYKNNTDFHGASYGTHESYLVPREVGFERLYPGILPILAVRQILTGSGKVGSESGAWCDYQISQRADFFMEPVNAETLYRRPIFNTRDEAHAEPGSWIRLHVISGDANMMPACTARKVGLVQLGLHLIDAQACPSWHFKDPVEAVKSISRDASNAFRVELNGRSWTTAYEILESYFAAAESCLDLDPTWSSFIEKCRWLIAELTSNGPEGQFRRHVDWAAKKAMIATFLEEERGNWKDGQARAFDLEYHNIDPNEGLYHALVDMDEVEPFDKTLKEEPTRALARGLAVRKFPTSIVNVCWRSITFKLEDRIVEVDLKPDILYSSDLEKAPDVETFIRILREER
ncbi:MAG: proteasome accessory factor PafA2 family protein [Fimbriimonadaceae bacterium]|nr:proteasome accessory factor PafA2 family protein [Fimbriimonadaceae bacterium]